MDTNNKVKKLENNLRTSIAEALNPKTADQLNAWILAGYSET